MLIKSASAVSLFDTARMVCGAGSIKLSVVRPSVRPSVCLITRSPAARLCGGFAAERRADRRYRPTAATAAAAAPQHGAQQQTVRAGNASSVTLIADVGS